MCKWDALSDIGWKPKQMHPCIYTSYKHTLTKWNLWIALEHQKECPVKSKKKKEYKRNVVSFIVHRRRTEKQNRRRLLGKSRLNGLVVWFSLRVGEVPGSIPGWALLIKLEATFSSHISILLLEGPIRIPPGTFLFPISSNSAQLLVILLRFSNADLPAIKNLEMPRNL